MEYDLAGMLKVTYYRLQFLAFTSAFVTIPPTV